MFRNTPSFPCAAAASSVAGSVTPIVRRNEFPSNQLEIDWEEDYLKPPNSEQLRLLTALPSAMVSSSKAKYSKRGRSTRLAREGQLISRAFDAMGSRPQPTNGISLEQGIQLEMTVEVRQFITSNTTVGSYVFQGTKYAISDFTGASTLLSVFDQYRIDQIEVWLEFEDTNAVGDYPCLFSAVDLDDAGVPTNIGQVQDHQGVIVTNGPAGHYHKFKPHVAIASFSGAFTSYSNVPSIWIDAASPNVQHFGLKTALQSSNGARNVCATVRAVISFRAPAIN